MNYSKLTRDELEAEAQREETPELIEELSKRVWEAQGNCAHRSEITWERNDGEMFLRCKNKECLTLKDVPDITDPAVFWPLAEKYQINIEWVDQNIVSVSWDAVTYYEDGSRAQDCDRAFHFEADKRIAVGFAVLKIKDKEND